MNPLTSIPISLLLAGLCHAARSSGHQPAWWASRRQV